MRDLRRSVLLEGRQPNPKAIRIAYRVLLIVLLVSGTVLAVLIAMLARGLCFTREWAFIVAAGVFLAALAGCLIPLVRSKVKKSRVKTVLTVFAAMLVLTVISLTVSFMQLIAYYGHTPVAFFDTPDGTYSVVLMKNTTVDESGAEYVVLTAYPAVGRMFFLMSDSGQAYVEGLNNVNWKAEWEDDRKITFTITDIPEGEHLSFSLDLRDYLVPDAQ